MTESCAVKKALLNKKIHILYLFILHFETPQTHTKFNKNTCLTFMQVVEPSELSRAELAGSVAQLSWRLFKSSDNKKQRFT